MHETASDNHTALSKFGQTIRLTAMAAAVGATIGLGCAELNYNFGDPLKLGLGRLAADAVGLSCGAAAGLSTVATATRINCFNVAHHSGRR